MDGTYDGVRGPEQSFGPGGCDDCFEVALCGRYAQEGDEDDERFHCYSHFLYRGIPPH